MTRLRDRVTIINAPDLVDPFNPSNPARDWDNAPPGKPERAEVRPVTGLGGSTENLLNEDTITSRWRILLAPDTSATPLSRVEWRGLLMEVDGEVSPVPDHLARIRHCFAFLRRVTG
jgi:hypothetical protein